MNGFSWHTASKKCDLLPKTVHIWCMSLTAFDSDIQNGLNLLDQQEQQRAYSFRFKHHFRQFVIAHSKLRRILSLYTCQPSHSLRFAFQKQGKPFLKDFSRLQFNLSHSNELAVCGLTLTMPLGIDIEFHKPIENYLDIAKHYFSKDEISELMCLPQHLHSQGFYNAWTRKESFIKAVGDGLYYPLDKFSVSLHPSMPAKVLSNDISPFEVRDWELHEFKPAVDYTAALAVQQRDNQYCYYFL